MEIRRLSDIFLFQAAHYPQKIALAIKKGLGWRRYSTEECLANITRVASGLLDIGMSKGDHLVLISKEGSPAWIFIDLACMQLGIAVVPLDPSLSARHIEQVFEETKAGCCIIEGEVCRTKIEKIRKPKHLFSFSRLPDVPHWSELSIEPLARHLASIEGLKAAVHEDDLATIVYTPYKEEMLRGVMLSHKNILTTVNAIIERQAFNCDKDSISIQPICQLFERILLYAYIIAGTSVYFKDRKADLFLNLKTIRPHFLGADPEVLEEIYAGLKKSVRKRGNFRKKLFAWAIQTGKQYKGKKKVSPVYWLKLKVADILVFRSCRRMLGGHLEGIALETGSFGSYLSRIFSAAGIEVIESLGKTELSGILSIDSIESIKSHSNMYGTPLSGMLVRVNKIGDQELGEISVKGNGVMMGYFNKPKMTARVISKEGWFRTGNMGKMVNGKHLLLIPKTDNKLSPATKQNEEE